MMDEGINPPIKTAKESPVKRIWGPIPQLPFTITILDRVYLYQIDQILTVVPENTADIVTVEGKEYCTLLTCTPYGINTHRLLVRGSRVDVVTEKQVYVSDEAYRIDNLIVTPLVALPILLVLIVIVCVQPVKREHILENEGEEENES